MKQFRIEENDEADEVAPRAGAWIETTIIPQLPVIKIVAPRAGAWIETLSPVCTYGQVAGRPPRGGVD